MGWLITFGMIFLLAVLPLGVQVRYNRDGLLVKLILGPVKLTVFPMPKKKKKDTKPPPQHKAATEPETKPQKQEKPLPEPPKPPETRKNRESGGSVLDFLPLVKTAWELLGSFRRKLRIDDLYLRLILASSDPCDLAMNYGRVWTAVGNLMPQLDRLFVIKKRDVEVECDFTASETTIIAHADVTITLGRLLALVTVYGIRAVKEFLTIQKKRKGGAAV